MEYKLDITVVVENGKEKSEHIFEGEHVNITRATKLWIENISGKESDFFETIKMWYRIDQNTSTTSYYTIKTSEPSMVESFRKYFVKRIDEENQSITFEWFI
ncbi:hypothetical protein [Cytobacillus sp.]|uniref:hypothetical protein n=1 Tax=Cytobacillus sp. TaxID=2675269 RepID=UPI003515ED27